MITNSGSTTYTGVRFYHGGDTFFGGDDLSFGFYDPVKRMVYIRNNDFASWGIMGFYASPSTPASRYFEGSTARDTATPANQDGPSQHGRSALHRRRLLPAVGPGDSGSGASWTIDAYETWSEAGPLQIFAPPAQNVKRSQTVTVPFRLQSLSSNVMTLTLAASCDKSWSPPCRFERSRRSPPTRASRAT